MIVAGGIFAGRRAWSEPVEEGAPGAIRTASARAERPRPGGPGGGAPSGGVWGLHPQEMKARDPGERVPRTELAQSRAPGRIRTYGTRFRRALVRRDDAAV